MNALREFLRKLRFRLHGSRFDADLAEEMRLHLDLRAAEKQAGGLAADAARAAAGRQFGNVTRAYERSREAWGGRFLDALAQDLRYGVRTLAANPGFTATAVLSLALGIGANTAIFSILNAVMLRSLPIEDPQKLVQIKMGGGGGTGELTNPIWEQVRDHQQAFSGALAYSPDRFDLADGGESRFVSGLWVSGDFFRVLGVPPQEGRVFTMDDDRHGGGRAGPVAVISQGFRKRNFPGEASVVGKTIRLNRHMFEIIGVTPPWFTGLDVDHVFDVAIPIGCEPLMHSDRSALNHRAWWWLRLLGRVRPSENIRLAEERMNAIATEIFRATLPPDWESRDQKEYLKNRFFLRPAGTGFSDTGRRYQKALLTLMAIVGFVLLIACANIANLMLARAAARQRELSVRMAIGASRSRVIRQLMTESLLVSGLGAGGGFLLALWGSRLLVRLLSGTRNPLEINLSPDVRVLAFTTGVAILTALLFGLAPALRGTRMELHDVLKENIRGSIKGFTRFNLAKALVGGQVALTLMLLVGAGLFLGTLRNLLEVDAGFNRHNVLLVSANLQQAALPNKAQWNPTYREILQRVRAIPGVVSAASSTITPISGLGWNQWTFPEGFVAKSREDTNTYFNRVSPGYFQTMRTPILIGRDFDERDVENAPKVMLINESTSRHFFGAANPIGKTIGLGEPGVSQKRILYRIIGVVKDAKYGRMDEKPVRTAYLTTAQDSDPWPEISYEIRAGAPSGILMPAVRSAVAKVNPGISLEFRDFETQVNESLLETRMVALLSALFGSLAVLLAMVGLYGTTSYAAARRRGEIGIRIALGAQPRSVIWLMLRDMVGLLAIGMAVGLGGALAAGRLVASLLYGIRPNEPAQLAGAALILAAATSAAAYLPARRAAKLDPMQALREE